MLLAERLISISLWDDSKTDGFTEELDMCVTDIKYDQVISNDSLSYYFKMQDAREEGREEGRAEGLTETARNMKTEGFDFPLIARMTGLTNEEIEKL